MQSLINNTKSSLQTLINEPLTFFGGLLLFLMIFSPNYNVAFKIVLIIIILFSILLSRVIFDKLNITKEVLLWYIVFLFHGIFFTVWGFYNKNNSSYVIRSTTYNIIWPVLYFIFTIGLYKRSGIIFIIRTLVIANFFVSLYLIGSALTLLHLLPSLKFITFSMSELSYDVVGGLVKVEIPAITSMMFTVPFIISLTILSNKQSFGFKKWFLYLSVLLSVIGVICTARRSLILNIFLSIFFTVLFSLWTGNNIRRVLYKNLLRTFIAGSVILTVMLIEAQRSGLFDISLVTEKFSGAFASSENVSDRSVSLRYNQIHMLLKSWQQKPLLGYGHGAVSDYVVRSRITPWIYEITYVALLFQTGIIGIMIYGGLLCWPIYKGLTLLKKGNSEISLIIIPVITGCACFLIANGTNPYLQSYDFMWTLFLPVAVINFFIKEMQ